MPLLSGFLPRRVMQIYVNPLIIHFKEEKNIDYINSWPFAGVEYPVLGPSVQDVSGAPRKDR